MASGASTYLANAIMKYVTAGTAMPTISGLYVALFPADPGASGTAGIATIAFANADTASLNPQVYYHQGTMTDSSGNQKVIFTGDLTINKKG